MHKHALFVSLILSLGLAACVSDRPDEEVSQTPTENSATTTAAPTGGEAVAAIAEGVTTVPELAEHPMGAFVSLGDVVGTADGPRVLNVSMATAREVSGFQFRLSGGTPVASQGGRAGESAFTVSTSEDTSIVIGFSLDGAAIPPGDGILTQITFQPDPGASEVCLTEPVLGDPRGVEVQTVMGGCVSIE